MLCVLLGVCLVLYWAFWGLGAALWLLPAGWRRFLWAVCIPFGLAFQISMVWWLLRLAGPIAICGLWANLLPALVLFGALLRSRNRRWLLASLRSRTFIVSVVLIVSGLLLALLPIAQSPHNNLGLTAISIGSRDGPEYALGARFFLDEGMGTPGEHWGQTEHAAYRNQWMEFNHFGPTALLAIAATTFRLELWQLISVLACALGACGAPLAMAFGQRVAGLRWWLAVAGGFLYALSPIWLFGAYNISLGQLIGTLGASSFLLLALSGSSSSCSLGVWWKRVAAGVFALWLFLSSYMMMIFFVVAIIGGWGLWRAVERRQWGQLGRVTLWGATVVILCTLLFPMRMWGLIGRVLTWGLLDAGWVMSPMLLPSMLGLGLNEALEPQSYLAHLWLFGVIAIMWASGVVSAWRVRDRSLGVILPLCGVILGAIYLLLLKDPEGRLLNSYKTYKLVAVFLPVILPSLLFGFQSLKIRSLRRPSLALIGLLVVIFLPRSLSALVREASARPLYMTRGLVSLGAIQNDPAITSVNITLKESWDILWAATFLSNKELHFACDTIYAQRGALTGEWTLERSFSPGTYSASARRLGDKLILRPTTEPAKVSLDWGIGWWDDEGSHRWSGRSDRTFSFVLKAVESIEGLRLQINGEFFVPGAELHAFIGKQELPLKWNKSGQIVIENLTLKSGASEILFWSNRQAIPSRTPGDLRRLLFNVTDVDIAMAPPVQFAN